MMEDMEEKLVLLLRTSPYISLAGTYGTYARAARELIANGVVVREKCEWATEEEVIYRYGSFIKRKYCTGCNESPKFDRETGKYILTKFCPNCGADMRKVENG